MPRRFKAGYEFAAQLLLPPQLFVFLPALFLGVYWNGGEPALVLLAIVMTLIGTLRSFPGARLGQAMATDPLTGLHKREYLIGKTDHIIEKASKSSLTTALVAIEIEEFDTLRDRFGRDAADEVLEQVAARIGASLRSGDTLARLEGTRFGLILAPVSRGDLESLLEIAARLQNSLAEAFLIDGVSAYLTACVGFCRKDDALRPGGAAMLDAAETALVIAKRNGSGAVRAFSADMRKQAAFQRDLSQEIEKALEIGQIRPWFQPQICTETGRISGFEALARWDHPERGTILPGEFLPIIEDTGLSERLSGFMLFGALTSLSSWDKAELAVPSVAVNFSVNELHNPKLLDRIRRELERFDLAPERLTVEVLETVVSRSEHDVVTRNIRQLSELGCRVDLDDFGTGHASIVNIQRFSVDRLKIDRSFISNIATDRNQERMVRAILTMASQLHIECVAEGVETPEQHALLAQLGCRHVQGFGIARPMPPEEVPDWLLRYRAKFPPRSATRPE